MSEFLLLPSPLLPATAYHRLADALSGAGVETALAPPEADSPLAAELVAAWARMVGPDTLLLCHSNAGYLAPLVRDRAGLDVPIVFMDAALPPSSGDFQPAPARFRDHLGAMADVDGFLPPWTRWWPREAYDGILPDDLYDELDGACPSLALDYFEIRLTAPHGWTDLRQVYLAFGPTYAPELALAKEYGWPGTVIDGGHLHFLFDPAGVAAEIVDLVDRLPHHLP